jgi:hypothetical protein
MFMINIELIRVIIKILIYKNKFKFLLKLKIFKKKIISNDPIAKITKYELFKSKSNKSL